MVGVANRIRMTACGYSRPFHAPPKRSALACKQTFAVRTRMTAPDEFLPSPKPSEHVRFWTNTGNKSGECRHRRWHV
jgi:hypothetical protein